MKKERYHPAADAEVSSAATYIEEGRPGYGEEFLDQLDFAIAGLLDDPQRWRIHHFGYRKYTMPVFRYQIWYREEDSGIYIIAVAHPSREPGYWKERI